MKKYIQYILSILIIFFTTTVSVAYAAGGCSTGGGLSNPLKNICNFGDFVALLLKAVIDIGLPIAVLFIVYSGFLFVTAQGNVTKIDEAKKTFFYTIIGVTIFLGSWALALIVENTIKLLTG
ncbi:MAG TPA: hypothetical protein ENI63_00385 [Candidatus Kaiserbacteria bacterium]|nr:hypothetical protein [Candidatus Kaiserbacteria bacterium]